MELAEKEIAELKKLKIGVLVRNTLPEILRENLISESEIQKLQKEAYSDFTFDVKYPVLKKVNPNISILENRTINGYTRYYKDPIDFNGVDYLITSEWYEKSVEDYIRWLKRHVKDSILKN